MGLKNSEHISKIIVSPQDPNTVFVASQVLYGLLAEKEGCTELTMEEKHGKTF